LANPKEPCDEILKISKHSSLTGFQETRQISLAFDEDFVWGIGTDPTTGTRVIFKGDVFADKNTADSDNTHVMLRLRSNEISSTKPNTPGTYDIFLGYVFKDYDNSSKNSEIEFSKKHYAIKDSLFGYYFNTGDIDCTDFQDSDHINLAKVKKVGRFELKSVNLSKINTDLQESVYTS
jgi:hypothetical protein